jgi:hypothetical protein
VDRHRDESAALSSEWTRNTPVLATRVRDLPIGRRCRVYGPKVEDLRSRMQLAHERLRPPAQRNTHAPPEGAEVAQSGRMRPDRLRFRSGAQWFSGFLGSTRTQGLIVLARGEDDESRAAHSLVVLLYPQLS